MANKNSFGLSGFLSLAIGAFFLLTGILGFVDTNSAGAEFARGVNTLLGGSNVSHIVYTVFSILEIVSGVILFLAPFGVLQASLLSLAVFIVFCIWAVKIVLDFFLFGKPFTPTMLIWIRELSLQVIVLIAIWFVRPERT